MTPKQIDILWVSSLLGISVTLFILKFFDVIDWNEWICGLPILLLPIGACIEMLVEIIRFGKETDKKLKKDAKS